DVAAIEDFAVLTLNGVADLAQADLGALLYGGDVADSHGRSILGLDDRLTDIVDIPHEANYAYVDLLKADLYKAPAGIAVVAGQLIGHLTQAEAVGHELIGIDAHLVFA